MLSKYFSDISSNNGHFNAAEYASGRFCAISIKATEGTGYTNPYYAGPDALWVRDAHRYSLPVLHYHFARPEFGNPRGQAEHFWNHVNGHFRRPGDYVVLDLETGTPSEGAVFAREYDSHLKAISGTHPVLYTYLSYYNSADITITSRAIWLAAYGSHQPPINLGRGMRLWAWQYTDGNGYGPGPQRYPGIPGTTDGSIMNSSTVKQLSRIRKAR